MRRLGGQRQRQRAGRRRSTEGGEFQATIAGLLARLSLVGMLCRLFLRGEMAMDVKVCFLLGKKEDEA